MNILFVGEATSGFGGIETVLQKVTSFLENDVETKNDYTLYFLCRDDRMDKAWLAGKRFVCHRSSIKISFLRRMNYSCTLARFIKQNQPDAVIAFDAPSCRVAAQAIRYSKKTLPLISWLHYSLDHKKHAEQVLAANYHLAISSGIKQQLIKRGVPSERISVIFNPVTPQNTVIPRPTDKAVFIYVGRLKFEGQKRLKDMLDAFSGLNGDWECHFIGDGSDAKVCQSYAQQLGITDHLHWHGWQEKPWEYIQDKIKHVSAFVMSSAFEGLPMTLLEAMSYGIYCVSSDCPSGPEDIIRNGINGQLYPPSDTTTLRSSLQDVVNRQTLLDAKQISVSIHRFYDETYYKEMKAVINTAIHHQVME
ncbi:lipopolysaccharide 1,6-galactosyltransferase [Pectobacterium parmentieri]|uniref:Lipopolysaccharide 1,6-galactosyltransferase n=1 Tax=Pectobacterium parmentieri TaxID=1905730 RepID=A0A8B3FI40_PECPM|nr:lipopolysaccharide 1,6-galactosyltransferase [Pectobacterium parmentieri]AOR61069.1 glycosyl transferase [Pectobacterium parmentieri]AYH07784.1 lipopolysaccharide 1,6-galactosyltransferase [Pectobacterium parmentieri]AYH12262.1 lipopolysaccharide 1,6-galactosyltransferase [Pectobacterium parmentieri]AYH16536.1 lipopolysaccharide 1,6-galactosyltransferase [Pectobacterium parmentieri]AYH20978.1 lipopolysaccharide 1,6-galactosyltransferase [Pectobacterium parmentieri]